MNIFVLDSDTRLSSQYYVDKHVVKIISEITQMCSTVLHKAEAHSEFFPLTKAGTIVKPTHAHHPVTKWIGVSSANYLWAIQHLIDLCGEYTYRYGRHHHYEQFIKNMLDGEKFIERGELTKFVPAMPPEYKVESVVESYRNYYKCVKLKTIQCNWTKRTIPHWLEQ